MRIFHLTCDLNKFFAATTFLVPLKKTVAIETHTATLECEVSNEKATVTWYKDGKELRERKRIKISADGKKRTLVLLDVRNDDEGEYTCVVGDNVKSTAGLFVERKCYSIIVYFIYIFKLHTEFMF